MEHKPFVELQAIAEVRSPESQEWMSREQRLERWIALLRADPDRKLRSLNEIEHLPQATRRECRSENSPLTVAYEDPLLRSAGLKSDRVGDCTDFFDLSDREMHFAFCSCHVGMRLSGYEAAERLDHILQRDAWRRKLRSTVSSLFGRIFRA